MWPCSGELEHDEEEGLIVTNGTLHLLCGKMASGKSTLALQLSQQSEALLLSEDQLLAELYPGQITELDDYVRCSRRLKAALRDSLVQLLQMPVSLVLDFPANTREQRRWLAGLAEQASASVELHYLECSDELCKSRLAERARSQPERRQTDTVEMFEAVTRHFAPPSADEGIPVTHHAPAQNGI